MNLVDMVHVAETRATVIKRYKKPDLEGGKIPSGLYWYVTPKKIEPVYVGYRSGEAGVMRFFDGSRQDWMRDDEFLEGPITHKRG